MIVDTSALIAIILNEPEGERFGGCVAATPYPLMSVASYLEAALVLTGRDRESELDSFIFKFNVTLEPVTIEQTKIAREAGRRYGKGHHRAALNFGDCFSYALAKATGEPLLFKGNDFGHTDVAIAGR